MFYPQKNILNKLIAIFLFCVACVCAEIPAEMEGMEFVSRHDGTFLIAGPTYVFDRELGAGGIHSESELWSPQKLRERLLFNRLSGVPSWTPLEPSVWMKTGNEVGDMIYQDFITDKENRPSNRTPILEGGFRTPAFMGFWVTARLFQDDHFSSAHTSVRSHSVDDEFSHFGENWPLFSTAYGGFGYSNSLVEASVIAGEEYLWIYGASSRWIPVHFKPRVEARLDVWNLSMTASYEDAEYQYKKAKEKGERKEVNGSIYYKCGQACEKGVVQLSAGFAFRAVEDSGFVYTELEEERVFWPFMELRLQPLRRLTADVSFGINERDWLVQDSIELGFSMPQDVDAVVGIKNISGSRLNPLADTKEFAFGHEIELVADGQFNLVQGYFALSDTLGNFALGGRASYWMEYGAETFDVDGFEKEGGYETRYGNASRINDWIYGFTGELRLEAWYKDMANFSANVGFERIDGDDERFEVNPAEFFVGFSGDWLLRKTFKISHAIRYRSDARWNLRSESPLTVKGDWFWDASFEQQFPKYGLYLTGTLLHVLADEVVEVPNGGYDRIRFICTAKKTF